MMIRAFLVLAAGMTLSACQPAIPDSGRGVGFDDQSRADSLAREEALVGSGFPAPIPGLIGSGVPAPASVTATSLPADGSAEATAAETARLLAATSTGASSGFGTEAARNSGVEPLNASPSNPAPALINSAGISNENNFDAVSGTRSINDDAARLAANRSQYQVVQPEALPDRTDTGPNIVAYAISTTHAPGTKIYSRFGLNSASKYQRSCGAFASADQAQIDFLARGGPAKDRKGMDPDGDGFACDWDPTPFRRAAQQG